MILSIIIPTFYGKDLLQKNLPYVFSAIDSLINTEIIIVDNNSNDGTDSLLHQRKNIKLIKLNKNYGFTGAVNKGVEQAKGKYLLLLNNDCFLEKDTIQKMINFLKNNKEYIATQPVVLISKLQNPSGKMNHSNIENIGYLVDLWKGKTEPVKDRNYQFSITKSKTNSKFQIQKPKQNIFKNRFAYGLSATCLLIKKDVFVKIGMFDENFHSYLEDVDVFIRLAKNGYKYYPTLNAYCLHKHMATSSQMGAYKVKQDFNNWIKIITKNYPLWFILLHFPTLFVERLRNLNGFFKKLIKLTYGRNFFK